LTYEVIVSPLAEADLEAITDVRTRNAIIRKAFDLEHEPDKQGKQLGRDLSDYRVVRAAGQRYRVIYQVATLEGVVTVVVVGIRKEGDKRDVYRVAGKRLGGR
jgi:mRNA interferase RelE/StbE